MPELPDVALFKRLVDRHCGGSVVDKVVVTDPESLEGASAAALQRRLKGKGIRACRRHGKVLFVEVESAGVLAMHFGTNGLLQYVPRDREEPPYVRLWVDFVDGGRLAYINPRRIGHVVAVESTKAYVAETGLGPDVLDPSFDEAAFAAMLRGRKGVIKSVLMDQTRVAGIGNIYADEILFQARLHPAVGAGALDRGEVHRLFEAMKSVLQTAIDCGAGAETLTDRLPNTFLIPQRHAGGRCPRCGVALREDKRSGRTGYYCPRCQVLSDR
jgi:formamidopyrimidine-DNA glycosylase